MTDGNPHAFHVRPGMRRGYRSEIPLPTRLVSNEEFPPLPQTAAQRAVEERILAEAGRLAPRLGLSRRDFLRRSGGIATSLLAMNAIFGRFFDVLPVEAADPGAFQARTGDPYFIRIQDQQPGPVYRIYHDSVHDKNYDPSQAIVRVLDSYEDLLKYVGD